MTSLVKKERFPPLSVQQPTLSDMTMYEMNFSLLVEDTLKSIDLPEYRQIIVEVKKKKKKRQTFFLLPQR